MLFNGFRAGIEVYDSALQEAEAFVFDFYGTIAEVDQDTPPMWQVLADLRYDCSPELEAIWESDAFDGSTMPTLHDSPSYDDWRRGNIRSLVILSGVPAEAVEAVVSHLIDLDKMWTVKPIPPALDILTSLRECGKRIGLCSNWDYPIETYLRQMGLPKFDAITTSVDVGARKPHIRMFQDISEKLHLDPREIAFVGDRWSTDIVGAVRAGFRPIWLRKGQASRNLPQIAREFESLIEFRSWIDLYLHK